MCIILSVILLSRHDAIEDCARGTESNRIQVGYENVRKGDLRFSFSCWWRGLFWGKSNYSSPQNNRGQLFFLIGRAEIIQLPQAGELIKIICEWSAPRRGRWLHNTQQKQKTNIRAFSGVQARDHRIERPNTYALKRTDSGNSIEIIY